MAPGTSSGPPGTGMRPGSGVSTCVFPLTLQFNCFLPIKARKAPGTGQRLRTGVAPSGPGTQAAQGIAINASVNLSDRPVTGQGVMGMKTSGLSFSIAYIQILWFLNKYCDD